MVFSTTANRSAAAAARSSIAGVEASRVAAVTCSMWRWAIAALP